MATMRSMIRRRAVIAGAASAAKLPAGLLFGGAARTTSAALARDGGAPSEPVKGEEEYAECRETEAATDATYEATISKKKNSDYLHHGKQKHAAETLVLKFSN